ncbi:MAG: hypothetical protein D6753_01800 [Planctomycetota bacterium]|nr:MAG: hypothetical protein D6753_01800 [Planctomycetota bacterium]
MLRREHLIERHQLHLDLESFGSVNAGRFGAGGQFFVHANKLNAFRIERHTDRPIIHNLGESGYESVQHHRPSHSALVPGRIDSFCHSFTTLASSRQSLGRPVWSHLFAWPQPRRTEYVPPRHQTP